ncbi:hypothetical protein BCR33DRAFT_859122 [Rhizoclosmatium globosum]|uniref:DNA polymerase V n=1 Tax=Rhizoclosmatium globosum TaxID=329046 RepID=A0A1Y2AW40_9FUNG|nr:hypothetical protein BCR33DRAFT_859122 [Rhizoclosmatium globosum]|eukprot:ORY26447.1 hypothetical protein BCR33DRAFT_859122 [Rhizoclosmatium globosum]
MTVPTPTPSATGGTLQLYWDLASLDASVRLTAAAKLSATLKEIYKPSDKSVEQVTKDTLDAAYSGEIAYALKRLIRGLSSSRDGARQGFTLALAELLGFLKEDHAFSAALIVDLIESLNVLTASVKGQEEREMYFARIFGLHAIVQSGLLTAPQTTADQKDWVPAVISSVVEAGMGTEGIWFVIVAQEEMKKTGYKFDWKAVFKGSWEKPSHILCSTHKARLSTIFKETTSTSPKLHPIFPAVLAHVFGPSPSLTLHEFWSIIDESMFNSSHDRKFIGFLVFQKCLESASKEGKVDVGVLFSKSFLRCLINSLAKGEDAVLNKAAKATAKQISTISSSSREIGLQVVFQLMGKNGHQRFDSITRTKTVENIVSSLNEKEVDTYVKYLMDLVVSGVSDVADETEEESTSTSATTRMWALDQLHSLLKSPQIPKTQSWIQRVLQFLCVHSLFIVEKPGNGIEKIEFTPEFDYKKDEEKKLAAGVMLNGEYWAYDLVQFIISLDGAGGGSKKNTANAHVRPVHALEARSLEARNMAIKEITAYRTKVAELQSAKTPNHTLIAQYKSFELLFLHVLLQVYTEPVDAVNILNELKSCADLVFSDKPALVSTPSKRKMSEEDDEEEEQPNPVDVIIDILLSFLAKPSALFRGVVENVFKVFCPVLTESGLQLIFDILKAKSGVAGAEELFEEGDEDEDDDEDDDDVMEIDASEVGKGDEEDDDDEDEDDEDDDDDEDEADEPEESVEELKNRLKAALGGVADDAADMNPDDAEDDDDEKSLNDEEMEAFDEKLSAIFRERKKVKTEQRDKKQQVLHFKLRVVDLIELFIKKQPANPLILSLIMPSLAVVIETADSDESRELHTKMTTLIKTKLATVKEVPPVESLESGLALLKEIQELAAKSPSASVAGLCSAMSLLVTRSIAHSHPEGVAVTSGQSTAETPSKKKKTAKAAAAPSELPPKSNVVVFGSLQQASCLGLQLLPDMAECISKGDVEKGFKVVQAFNIISACLQKLPVKENTVNLAALKRFQLAFVPALLAASQLNDEKGMTLARVKELVKPSISIVKRLKKALEKEGAPAAFAEAKKALEGRSDEVKTALKGLLTVL